MTIWDLGPGCRCLLASRHGGVGGGRYATLNCSYGVGDGQEVVAENRRVTKRALSIPYLLSAGQVHGDKVYVLADGLTEDLEVAGYDALITDRSGVGLMIQHADCQPVLLHDPQRRVIGAVHSGWRGSVGNITAKTVATMTARFGTDPKDLLAVVGPSLGPCCAEFVNHARELPKSFSAFMVKENHFDFWAITRQQLSSCGVLPDNIKVAGICTSCSENYFSYRRACRNGDGVTGRNCSIIAWAE